MSKLKKITIVGGGSAGWMAAAALSRMFGQLIEISLIESDEIGIIGVGEATIPSIHLFNNLLGLDENEFIKTTKGTIKLGIEFVDWYKEGHRYMHAFGQVGKETGMIPFHNYWLKARETTSELSLWDFSLNFQAAIANKFARPEHVNCAPLEGMPWAFHFDAGLYAQYLRKYAEGLGVKRVEGKITNVKINGQSGFIDSVELASGQDIEGDLFIDCSGFTSLLMGKALGVEFEDYSQYLPVNRAWAVPCESVYPITPYTRSTARSAGWQWRIPLQHRIGNGHVFSAEYMSEDEAHSILMANLDGTPLDDARLIKFTTGRRKHAFHKNCVSIGLSYGFLEPLESTAIHFIQASIARLIEMLPNSDFNPILVEQFNNHTNAEFDLVRDFIILHYHAQNRHGNKFWDEMRQRPITKSLADKIEMFREAGILLQNHSDLFKYSSWLQVLIGQGVIPKSANPYVENISDETLEQFLGSIKSTIVNAVRPLPLHDDFLSKCKR